MAFDVREDDTWPLEHVSHDIFCWLQSRDDLVSRARTVLQPLSYYLLHFDGTSSERIDSLYWPHDADLLETEKYALASNLGHEV